MGGDSNKTLQLGSGYNISSWRWLSKTGRTGISYPKTSSPPRSVSTALDCLPISWFISSIWPLIALPLGAEVPQVRPNEAKLHEQAGHPGYTRIVDPTGEAVAPCDEGRVLHLELLPHRARSASGPGAGGVGPLCQPLTSSVLATSLLPSLLNREGSPLAVQLI